MFLLPIASPLMPTLFLPLFLMKCLPSVTDRREV
nr:MAG TPA: hypothetical protein [Caudoviricetes sp.]